MLFEARARAMWDTEKPRETLIYTLHDTPCDEFIKGYCMVRSFCHEPTRQSNDGPRRGTSNPTN